MHAEGPLRVGRARNQLRLVHRLSGGGESLHIDAAGNHTGPLFDIPSAIVMSRKTSPQRSGTASFPLPTRPVLQDSADQIVPPDDGDRLQACIAPWAGEHILLEQCRSSSAHGTQNVSGGYDGLPVPSARPIRARGLKGTPRAADRRRGRQDNR